MIQLIPTIYFSKSLTKSLLKIFSPKKRILYKSHYLKTWKREKICFIRLLYLYRSKTKFDYNQFQVSQKAKI